jgi:hypothetical protein
MQVFRDRNETSLQANAKKTKKKITARAGRLIAIKRNPTNMAAAAIALGRPKISDGAVIISRSIRRPV